MRTAWLCAGFIVANLTACAGGDGQAKGEEEETELLDDDGKADSQLRPTDHGAIAFGTAASSALTEAERFHAWTFELSGEARVDLTTSYALLGQRRTDTVLYLYKQKAEGGWGAYVARNDDHGATTYSQLIRTLDAGRYRALVKGHLATTLGKFKITVGCNGAGCAPVDPNACVFGATYHDLEAQAHLAIANRNKIHPDTLRTLSAEDQHRLVLAVQQSAHTDVTTPEEAIARVDQQEVNVTWIVEPAARRTFVAFEYGAGDNSYGAIFSRADGAMVTNIHDGDLAHCTAKRERCLLPEDWNALKAGGGFTRTRLQTITSPDQLAGAAAEQALVTVRQVYGDATLTLAQGLARADGHQLNVGSFRHAATGRAVDAIELGAGDTSVGAVFFGGTTQRAAVISDLMIDSCAMFE